MPPLSALLFIACSLAIGGLFMAQPKGKPMAATSVMAGLALCGMMVLGIALAREDSSLPVRLDLNGVSKRLAGDASLIIGTDARTADIVVPAYRGAGTDPAGADTDAASGERNDRLVVATQSPGGANIALQSIPIDTDGSIVFKACFHPVGTAFDAALCERGSDGEPIRTKMLTTPMDAVGVEPVGIQLYREDPPPGDDEEPRTRSRRGLVLALVPTSDAASSQAQTPRIRATFNDPPSTSVGRCPDGVGLRLASSAAANSGDDFVFPQIGAALSGGRSATPLPFDAASCRFTDATASADNRFGRDSRPTLRIGGSAAMPDAEILLRGRVLDFPLPAIALYLFAAAFAALRMVVASGERRDSADLEGPVTLLLFYLLGIRLLAALAAIHYDPTGIDPSRIVEQACVELLLVPLLLAAVLRIGRTDAAMQSVNDVIFYILIAGGLWWLGIASLSLLIGGAVLVAIVGIAPLLVLPGLRGGASWAAAPIATARAQWQRLPDWLRAAGPWLVIAAVVLLLFRMIAAALSIKEALPIPGVRIALSSLVLPFMIMGCAALLARIDRPVWFGRTAPMIGIAAFWLFLGLIMIGAAAARDFGFTLVYFWPVGLVGILLMIGWRSRLALPRAQTAMAVAPLPLAAIGLALIGLAVAGWVADMAQSASLADRLQPALLIDANMSRLLAIFAPDRIEGASNTEAFQTLELVLLLDRIAEGNLFGHGYLAKIYLGVMTEVQLSDNMPAVHLIWPYGRVGAAAMLLALSLFGVAVRRQIGPLGEAQGTLVIAAHIATWLLVATAVYMVLANLLLVPFTGRNIFLLSATSWGDVVEGLTVIMLIALPLLWRRMRNG